VVAITVLGIIALAYGIILTSGHSAHLTRSKMSSNECSDDCERRPRKRDTFRRKHENAAVVNPLRRGLCSSADLVELGETGSWTFRPTLAVPFLLVSP
jgi:hypothetical protein